MDHSTLTYETLRDLIKSLEPPWQKWIGKVMVHSSEYCREDSVYLLDIHEWNGDKKYTHSIIVRPKVWAQLSAEAAKYGMNAEILAGYMAWSIDEHTKKKSADEQDAERSR